MGGQLWELGVADALRKQCKRGWPHGQMLACTYICMISARPLLVAALLLERPGSAPRRIKDSTITVIIS